MKQRGGSDALTGLGTTYEPASGSSLKERIEKRLKPDLLADPVSISDYDDMPFAILLYHPTEELTLRREIELLGRDLYLHKGRLLHTINLADLMWEAVEKATPPEALFDAEREYGLELTVETIHNIVSNQVPLDQMIRDRLKDLDPAKDLAVLVRAGSLYPVYRTSALLENLKGVRIPTILCYPGTLRGVRALGFMDVCEPDPNYRPRIY